MEILDFGFPRRILKDGITLTECPSTKWVLPGILGATDRKYIRIKSLGN